jgi:hypothetical protein
MPRQTEPSLNNAMGTLLGAMLPRSDVRSENTQAIYGHPGLRPDILITAPGRAPVVIEAEYMPAAGVEAEARDRLGLETAAAGREIEAAVALRYPDEVGEVQDLSAALSGARLSYCVFTENRGAARFPESGWLDGSVEDLADMVRLVSVPQHAVDRATAILQEGIDGAASILDELDRTRPGITEAVANLLGMANVRQTRRMACAIIANALVFHDQIAGMHARINSLALACGDTVDNPQGEVLAAWTAILNINYWPIFAIAKDILEHLDSADAARILRRLRDTAQAVNATGVENAHDLTGRIFQRLIADRKYLATFYTLPASAALLARLAVARLEGVDWSNRDAIGNLRVGDFACGTGALLSAVYEHIAARHEREGGNLETLHPLMMETILRGCDVMPSAIHITSSALSGAQPSIGYRKSHLYTMPYGRQKDGDVRIGSLELLQSADVQSLLNTNDPALRTSSLGDETSHQLYSVDIPHTGFELVLMNPPFTSNTKHYDAGDGVQNAAFAAFDTTAAEQDEMAHRLRQLTKDVTAHGITYHNTTYHGHAGLASAFADLAERKVRPNGVVALVLPFTALNGSSWARFRELIATRYKDITIVSIAANGKDISFSSDTGMAECLVIARKTLRHDKPSLRARFVSLYGRPSGFVGAAELARLILKNERLWRLEEGPYGGTPLYLGSEQIGEMLDAPLGNHESGWGAARVADAAVAQVAYSLSIGKLWLPGKQHAHSLPIAPLGEVGRRGLDSQFFISAAHDGPFTKTKPSPTATYPALWNHDARKETRMVCVPDSQLQVKKGMEAKAAEVWATAGRAHVNRDFRFNSQPLTATITEQKSAGGRAWPNVTFADARFDYPFALWCNSTLGLLSYWWHANRQQDGRGQTTIRSVETLPILDFRTLGDTRLRTAQDIFDEFRDLDLKPAYLADADENRALLDRQVVCDLLGFDEDTYHAVRRLAAKWCAEPSVHGGKKRAVNVE